MAGAVDDSTINIVEVIIIIIIIIWAYLRSKGSTTISHISSKNDDEMLQQSLAPTELIEYENLCHCSRHFTPLRCTALVFPVASRKWSETASIRQSTFHIDILLFATQVYTNCTMFGQFRLGIRSTARLDSLLGSYPIRPASQTTSDAKRQPGGATLYSLPMCPSIINNKCQ